VGERERAAPEQGESLLEHDDATDEGGPEGSARADGEGDEMSQLGRDEMRHVAKKQIATLVEEPDPTRCSPWWWRKGHLALDGDPSLRDTVEGHVDLVLHAGLREPRLCGHVRERRREIERERKRIRTGRVRVWG
jgi:hypothetical protein